MRLILASQSPRRREHLRGICPEFEVTPGDIDEVLEGGPTVEGFVTHLPESQLFELRTGLGGPTPPVACPLRPPAIPRRPD